MMHKTCLFNGVKYIYFSTNLTEIANKSKVNVHVYVWNCMPWRNKKNSNSRERGRLKFGDLKQHKKQDSIVKCNDS